MPHRFQTRALYLQVRDAIIDNIREGRWSAGSQLPNEVQLSNDYGVSQGTVRKALDTLELDHIVVRKQGRGTFVSQLDTNSLAFKFYKIVGLPGLPTTETKRVELADPSGVEKERLALSTSQKVIRLHRLRLMNDVPFMVETVTLPEDLVPGLLTEAEPPGFLSIYVFEKTGKLAKTARDKVAAIAADAVLSSSLLIPLGAPLLSLDRVLIASDGTAIEYRVSYCNLGNAYYEATIS